MATNVDIPNAVLNALQLAENLLKSGKLFHNLNPKYRFDLGPFLVVYILECYLSV